MQKMKIYNNYIAFNTLKCNVQVVARTHTHTHKSKYAHLHEYIMN